MSEAPSAETVAPMDPQTLEALKGSIAKWEGIVARTVRDLGSVNCPLCHRFMGNQACGGCPVAAATGKPGCEGTPYMEFGHAEYEDDEGAMALAAKSELDFLKSLLPSNAT